MKVKDILGWINLELRPDSPSPARERSKEVLQFLEGLIVVSVVAAVARKTGGGAFYSMWFLASAGLIALCVWCGSFVFRVRPKTEGERPIVQLLMIGLFTPAFVWLVMGLIPEAIIVAITELARCA
jgi:hypothetical protein